jgi:CO/xanthine dehydrogenase FAD-binding subunit
MKPALFKYFDPASIEDTLMLLADFGEDGKILAGGQTLSPMLNFRAITPSALIDINRVKELGYHTHSDSGTFIGALTRQQTLEDDDALGIRQPLVAAAIPMIAHRAIRNRGTVGGSLAHADPAAEWGGLALALEAEFKIRKYGAADRGVPAADFFRDMLATALGPDELLVEIKLPTWPSGAGWSFLEFSRRRGDFAIAGVACQISLDVDGRCSDVRLAAFGVGSTPIRLKQSEAILLGTPCSENTVKAVSQRARAEVSPMDDNHASADYRRHLIGVLVERSIAEAVSRASHH